MARKIYTPERIIGMLREAEVRLSQGDKIGSICRSLGISEQSYYRWRRHYNTLRPHSSLGYQPPAPETILPRPAGLPYAALRAASQGDQIRRDSNSTGGPP